nr:MULTISPECIES: nuclear transport factor 2 family protein [unclassified Streptomyces]
MERGDFDEVSDLWLDSEDTPEGAGDTEDAEGTESARNGETAGDAVSCVHPGWPVLTGRGEVLRSYALIMANTEYIQFFLTDLKVGVAGDTALVTCTENILSGGPPPEAGGELGPLVGQLVVATNVFRRTPDGWKLWSHHASPVLAETDDEEGEETPT